MKKNTFFSLMLPVLIILLASCTTTKSEDVDNAAKDVQDSQKELDQANEEYAKEVAIYRSSMETSIRDNKLAIAKMTEQKSHVKEGTLKARNLEVEALKKRNDEMESRLNEYKSDNKENWKAFKREFNNDMDELGKAFKDLSVNNVN